jgi:hypothetical protein
MNKRQTWNYDININIRVWPWVLFPEKSESSYVIVKYPGKRKGCWEWCLKIRKYIKKKDDYIFNGYLKIDFRRYTSDPKPDTRKITMNIKTDKMEFEQVENDNGFMEEIKQ